MILRIFQSDKLSHFTCARWKEHAKNAGKALATEVWPKVGGKVVRAVAGEAAGLLDLAAGQKGADEEVEHGAG